MKKLLIPVIAMLFIAGSVHAQAAKTTAPAQQKTMQTQKTTVQTQKKMTKDKSAPASGQATEMKSKEMTKTTMSKPENNNATKKTVRTTHVRKHHTVHKHATAKKSS